MAAFMGPTTLRSNPGGLVAIAGSSRSLGAILGFFFALQLIGLGMFKRTFHADELVVLESLPDWFPDGLLVIPVHTQPMRYVLRRSDDDSELAAGERLFDSFVDAVWSIA